VISKRGSIARRLLKKPVIMYGHKRGWIRGAEATLSGRDCYNRVGPLPFRGATIWGVPLGVRSHRF